MATKMTQRTAIAYVLDNCTVPSDVREKLVSMKATLDKKSKQTGERKPTKTQKENEGLKEIIVSNMEPNRLYSISEIAKEMPFGEGVELSNQKVSSLVKQLKDAGKVERFEEKRKAKFRVVM